MEGIRRKASDMPCAEDLSFAPCSWNAVDNGESILIIIVLSTTLGLSTSAAFLLDMKEIDDGKRILVVTVSTNL